MTTYARCFGVRSHQRRRHAAGVRVAVLSDHKLPERVATTDLIYEVAEIAQGCGTTFYLLGGTTAVIERAAQHLHELYPRLQPATAAAISIRRMKPTPSLQSIARPDILWLGLGVPAEQRFALRNRDRLRGVGLIKTSGGLFDFLSGKNSRAPDWMQAAGLEWAYRIYLEPKRLVGRYIRTNPHALFLLLTKTKPGRTEDGAGPMENSR
jgi:exopolysaccharide biosynthesis WecB/TagA/CpsF family protein